MPRCHQGIIREHQELLGGYRKLTVELPQIAHAARAGQFIHVLTRPKSFTDPLLRRAFSILSANGDNIQLLYRVTGHGTLLMKDWEVGKKIDLLGPLGRPFPEPKNPVLLVGGGVGIPPLVMMAIQTRAENPNLPITALIGARTAQDILGTEELENCHATIRIATNDGGGGQRGLVTDILDEILREQPRDYSIYSCGPLPMLHAVGQVCAEHNQRAMLSLEENMPCGIGVCNGCAIPVLDGEDEYHQFRRICVDGPALWSDQIDWEKIRS